MTFRHFIVLLSATALVAVPATAVSAAPAAETSATSMSRPISPDADFLIAAHQAGLTQIKAGRLAARRGADPVVRDLGRQFAAYHRKLDGEVRKAAADLAVVLPEQPNTDQQTLLGQYEAAGDQFDTLFLDSQLVAHERALKAARLVLDTGSEPAVRQIVTEAVPVVQQHHGALMAAQAKIGNKQRRQ